VPDATIIIASRNGARTLRETLDSLTAQQTDRVVEIVLSDNGSTDGTRALFEDVAAQRPDWPMRVVDASARAGKSFALNTAIRAGAAPKILLFDDDDVAAPGWLDAMLRALDRHAFVHGVREWRRLNPAWAVETRSAEPLDWRYWRPPFAKLAPGCVQGFRREVFDAVGGCDEAFDTLQDLRFCIEAHVKGYDLVAVPEAEVHYRLRADRNAVFRQQRRYARGAAQLRRSYPSGSHLAGPWKLLALGATLMRLGGEGLERRIRSAPPDCLKAADYARRTGKAIGDLEGAIAFRVAPDQPVPRLLQRLRAHRSD
jgi:cellulose synthase/poly-beta-1,6-N-acetylglucosamine synthase-like glycosyltransferase